MLGAGMTVVVAVANTCPPLRICRAKSTPATSKIAASAAPAVSACHRGGNVFRLSLTTGWSSGFTVYRSSPHLRALSLLKVAPDPVAREAHCSHYLIHPQ